MDSGLIFVILAGLAAIASVYTPTSASGWQFVSENVTFLDLLYNFLGISDLGIFATPVVGILISILLGIVKKVNKSSVVDDWS